MNVKNNKRRQRSQKQIEGVFVELLQSKTLSEISVSDICKRTGLNRSTFYANYEDIYALADTIRERMEADVAALYADRSASIYSADDFLRLFCHIKENQLYYKTYFKLGYDDFQNVNLYMLTERYGIQDFAHVDYHVAFFMTGFNAIVKKWLAGGCKESPEEMSEILKREYRGRT